MFKKSHLTCLILCICSTLVLSVASKQRADVLPTILGWWEMEFDYDTEAERQADINSGFYNRSVPVPRDVDVQYEKGKQRVFITIPRTKVGSPITVGTVLENKKINNNPVIRPYPDWSWHRDPKECKTDRIISVYRVKIDRCGRLWVLDYGKYGGDTPTCSAQLLAFDLSTDKLVFRMELPESVLESKSTLVTPVVDVRDSCSEVFVYIADNKGFSIIVVDVANRDIWRAGDKTLYPYPDSGTFIIGGYSFELMDGVIGLDIEPYIPGKDPKLFYQTMSSRTLNWVYTSFLHNKTRFGTFGLYNPEIFHTYKSKRLSQSCAFGVDRNGIAYFGQMNDSMYCWNTKSSDYGKYIGLIETDKLRLQFASGVKIITNLDNEQELWILTSANEILPPVTNITKYRVIGAKISSFISKTSCEKPNGVDHHHYKNNQR